VPRADVVYRCPVCHLQMVFNAELGKMQPLPPNGDPGDRSPNVA
jgi:hypothetical protein